MVSCKIKTVILLVGMMPLGARVFAQPDSTFDSNARRSALETCLILGKIIPHDDTLNQLVNRNIKATEIRYSFKKSGRVIPYHQGLSLVIADLGNHDHLGYAFGVIPNVSITTNTKNRVMVNLRLGLGAAWVTKKFSFASNIENVAISTNLNIMASLNANLQIRITEKSKIYLGLNALHLSNGGFKKPNYGLNMLGASGGFSIAFSNKRECKVPKKSSDDLQIETWPQIKLYVGMGVKETGDAGGPKYFPVSLQIAAAHRVAKFVALGFGVDIAHDGSSKFQIEQSNEVYTSPNDAFQVGASIYAELPLNRFSVFARQGFYLYNANPDLPFGYQNIGFSYRIGHRVAIFISLKSHLNNADHIYAGLALSI